MCFHPATACSYKLSKPGIIDSELYVREVAKPFCKVGKRVGLEDVLVTDTAMDDRNMAFVLKEYSFSRQAIAVGMRLGKLRGVRLIRKIRDRAGEVDLLLAIYYAILIIDGE